MAASAGIPPAIRSATSSGPPRVGLRALYDRRAAGAHELSVLAGQKLLGWKEIRSPGAETGWWVCIPADASPSTTPALVPANFVRRRRAASASRPKRSKGKGASRAAGSAVASIPDRSPSLKSTASGARLVGVQPRFDANPLALTPKSDGGSSPATPPASRGGSTPHDFGQGGFDARRRAVPRGIHTNTSLAQVGGRSSAPSPPSKPSDPKKAAEERLARMKREEERESALRFGIWAHNLALLSSLYCGGFGVPAVVWARSRRELASTHSSEFLGYYTVLVGVGMLALELLTAYRIPLFASEAWRPLVRAVAGACGCGDSAAADEAHEARGAAGSSDKGHEEDSLPCVTQCLHLPWRGMAYLLVGLPILSRASTAIAGVAVVVTGMVYVAAVLRGEVGDGRSTKRKLPSRGTGSWSSYFGCDCCCCMPGEEAASTEEAGISTTCGDRCQLWALRQAESGEIGKWVLLSAYIAANFIFGVYLLTIWSTAVQQQHDDYDTCILEINPANPGQGNICTPPLTFWAPWAKMCGGLLNLNCSIMLLPVLKGFIRALNNCHCGTTSLASLLPLRKHLTFHRYVASVVFALAAVHTFAHWMNYAYRPDETLDTFPAEEDPTTESREQPWFGTVRTAPWYTGAAICIAMLFIYSGAVTAVRRSAYWLFWACHHAFALFYVCLIFHGPVAIYWCGVPLLLYAAERLWRVMQGQKVVYLRAVRWLDPVLALEFAPEDRESFSFVEGQYLYLSVPAVEGDSYHPFTISSSVGDRDNLGFITCHIRVHPGGWTERVKDYLVQFNPKQEFPLVLHRYDESGRRQIGKATGPDGLPILRVDGCFSAPSQHYCAYDAALVVGAGIGVTPLASILRGVLLYRWKRGHRPAHLHVAWVVRQSEVAAFQWFVQALAQVEAERARDVAAGNVNDENFVEIHLFVTRVNKQLPESKWPKLLEAAKLGPDQAEHAPFRPEQLLREMVLPSQPSARFQEVMQNPQRATNRLQDVYVWDGRPPWEHVVGRVSGVSVRGAGHKKVGITFCGAAPIAKALKEQATLYSDFARGVQFTLHKEIF